jgi:hypothetical protein
MKKMKKIKTLVIGLMLVTMLSMLAMPALAATASTSHSRGYACSGSHSSSFYVYVVGYFDTGNPSVFTSGSTSPQYYGYTVESYSDVIVDTIVWANGVGRCNTCGIHVDATAWVSPVTFPNQRGGEVRTW